MVRKADGYWYRGDHWDHRGVSAVLVVKNSILLSWAPSPHDLGAP